MPAGIDSLALESALRRHVRGEVRFDNGSRALYATDGSNYRQVPIGVVTPRDNDDVIAAVATCHEHGAPLLCRGAGTSLAGQCCNVAVVLDFSKYMAQILELDPGKQIARVQPGVILDHLRAAAEKDKLTFGPDPQVTAAAPSAAWWETTHAACIRSWLGKPIPTSRNSKFSPMTAFAFAWELRMNGNWTPRFTKADGAVRSTAD